VFKGESEFRDVPCPMNAAERGLSLIELKGKPGVRVGAAEDNSAASLLQSDNVIEVFWMFGQFALVIILLLTIFGVIPIPFYYVIGAIVAYAVYQAFFKSSR